MPHGVCWSGISMDHFPYLVSIAQLKTFTGAARNDTLQLIFNATSSSRRKLSAAKNLPRGLRPLAFILIAPLGVNSVTAGSHADLPRIQSLTVTLHFGEYEEVN